MEETATPDIKPDIKQETEEKWMETEEGKRAERLNLGESIEDGNDWDKLTDFQFKKVGAFTEEYLFDEQKKHGLDELLPHKVAQGVAFNLASQMGIPPVVVGYLRGPAEPVNMFVFASEAIGLHVEAATFVNLLHVLSHAVVRRFQEVPANRNLFDANPQVSCTHGALFTFLYIEMLAGLLGLSRHDLEDEAWKRLIMVLPYKLFVPFAVNAAKVYRAKDPSRVKLYRDVPEGVKHFNDLKST